MSRKALVERKTKETQIRLSLNLDGTGASQIESPVPFLNHMMQQVAVHGGMDLELKAQGDVEVDAHHTVEDVAICLGEAVKQALGDKKGIVRYGTFSVPLDEALSRVTVDFGGRPYVIFQAECLKPGRIGDFDVELVRDFFQGFANHALANVHVHAEYGENRHHIVESMFKAFARAVRSAVRREEGASAVPSTKGTL